MKVLTVRETFGDYQVGQMITDPDEQAAVLAAGHVHKVTPTIVPDSFFQADADPKAGKKA